MSELNKIYQGINQARATSIAAIVIGLLFVSTYAYYLFWWQPTPFIVESPVPTTIEDTNLHMAIVYTRTIDAPVTLYVSYIRDDGLIIDAPVVTSAGAAVGTGTVELVRPLPCLPPGDWVRRVRGEYNLGLNGLITRFSYHETEPFTIDGELSEKICR